MMKVTYQANESSKFKGGNGGRVSDSFTRWFTIGTHGLQRAILGPLLCFLKEIIQALYIATTDRTIGAHHRCHITDS